MYRILDQQNRIKLESTLAICQAWIKHYNAGFFCRIVPVEVARQTSNPATFSVFAY